MVNIDTAKATLLNLKNYDAYDYESYHLRKEEAEVCIEGLESILSTNKVIPLKKIVDNLTEDFSISEGYARDLIGSLQSYGVITNVK